MELTSQKIIEEILKYLSKNKGKEISQFRIESIRSEVDVVLSLLENANFKFQVFIEPKLKKAILFHQLDPRKQIMNVFFRELISIKENEIKINLPFNIKNKEVSNDYKLLKTDDKKKLLKILGKYENNYVVKVNTDNPNYIETLASSLLGIYFIRYQIFNNQLNIQEVLNNPTSIDNNQKKKDFTMNTKSLNTILYGPPGTGKTYNTINKALEIIYGDELKVKQEQELKKLKEERKNSNKSDKEDVTKRDAEQSLFRNLLKSKENQDNYQIVFTTFHQNYTYEDFMIGIKPNIGNTQGLTFVENEGVFYKIAQKAKEEFEKPSEDNFDEIYALLIESYKENIDEDLVLETPIHKKKFKIELNSNDNFRAIPIEGKGTPMVVKRDWLKEYLFNNKIIDWKSYTVGLANKLIEMGFKKGGEKKEIKKYVLIIDEINRANISKVFGELITLLEDDKRIGAENELKVTLPNGEEFGVPPNLFVIGTMNTADKSIALIDIALRRRFHFVGMYPDVKKIKNEEEKDFLKKLNENIYKKKNESADWLIGHAYFMKGEEVEDVIKDKILPLLMEYFGNKKKDVAEMFDKTGYFCEFDMEDYTWSVNKEKR